MKHLELIEGIGAKIISHKEWGENSWLVYVEYNGKNGIVEKCDVFEDKEGKLYIEPKDKGVIQIKADLIYARIDEGDWVDGKAVEMVNWAIEQFDNEIKQKLLT